MKVVIILLGLGLVFSTTVSAEAVTNGMLIATVQKAMAVAHYKETGLDRVATQTGHDLKFWAVGDGVLILRYSKTSTGLLGMTYSLCDERPKALRRTFDFNVSSFDPSTGTMCMSTRKGDLDGAANQSQPIRHEIVRRPTAAVSGR